MMTKILDLDAESASRGVQSMLRCVMSKVGGETKNPVHSGKLIVAKFVESLSKNILIFQS